MQHHSEDEVIHLEEKDSYPNHASVSEDDPLYLLKSITLCPPMLYTPSFVKLESVDDAECAEFIADEFEGEDAHVSQVAEELSLDDELPFRGVDIQQEFAPLQHVAVAHLDTSSEVLDKQCDEDDEHDSAVDDAIEESL